MKILQVSAEFYGLAKTGGLADMVASLTRTVSELGADVRVCLPAYLGTRERLQTVTSHGTLQVLGQPFEIVEGYLPASTVPIILLDCPSLFGRRGDPYRDENGDEFPDNGFRFGCFCEAVALLAQEGLGGWRPDILQIHDWHTGILAPMVRYRKIPVKTLFTIHNFSFQGNFSRQLFDRLQLPQEWWGQDKLGIQDDGFSFMKAALNYADHITTVSSRYAEEIRTPAFGGGLERVVEQNADRLTGIINGIDSEQWNPCRDQHLVVGYNADSAILGKSVNKAAVQEMLGLPVEDKPLVVFIGRFAEQKGPDLILEIRRQISEWPLQLVVLGSGEKDLERAFRDWSADLPQQVATVIEVNEKLAHLFTAAADVQLMPSRFEPCGLSQMYAQAYGTLPVATATGGLVDTIVDATPENLASHSASGVLFGEPTADALATGLERALKLVSEPETLARMRRNGMSKDFSWQTSAKKYFTLYRELLATVDAPRC